MAEQGTLFDKRFLGKHAGQIMSDPTTALVELVANSWDAFSTKVTIDWPNKKSGTPFRIEDNGKGMTRAQFEERWRTLDYNRLDSQGATESPPEELKDALPREVYGQNGRGRHAAFLFSSPYLVRTWRDGNEVTFRVSQGKDNPIELKLIGQREGVEGHGTEIVGESVVPSNLTADDVRGLLSTRFLLDPSFAVSVDGVRVTFEDVPSDALQTLNVPIDGRGVAQVLTIDAQRADRTTKQHGIAWWVNRRLVGHANWRAFEGKFIDGRTEEAKRYSFVVLADFLKPAVRADWSGFEKDNPVFAATQETVHERIRDVIAAVLKERRRETKAKVEKAHRERVSALPKLSQDRWNGMLNQLIEKCPTIGEKQIDQVMGLLATMELAESQYELLDRLHDISPDDVDALNDVMKEWSIKTAKAALDEVSRRLKLIEEIRLKTDDPETDEVQELQPLFEQALWIFGPEFESIEFTSNRGMTTVIQKLFGSEDTGSRNRPDFVVLPEGTLGIYARPRFDEDSNEAGTEAMVIIELKRPGVPLGSDEKNQAWKYIKELKNRGHIDDLTRVRGFVLGDRIEPGEHGVRTEGDNVRILPMLYSTFVGQAEKRMLNLHRRLSDAPFMREILQQNEAEPIQTELLTDM
ncbi:MAG: ATP-binding protein [Hyphomonadaceae bacterium]|nr:ATP-binding protein [Hyphomonadaceae bacterium]